MQPKASTPASNGTETRRSSQVWTQAESAAGCVLRYVTPMRAQLTELFENPELADRALSLLLNHLAKKGYGGLAKGRLRDFLLRGIRSAAKATLGELPEAERPAADPKTLHTGSESWLNRWNDSLLEATWRALEREEHADPDRCDFTALWTASQHPEETPEMLAVRVGQARHQQIAPDALNEHLQRGRQRFEELLEQQVAGTLENPTTEAVRAEIAALGLQKRLP